MGRLQSSIAQGAKLSPDLDAIAAEESLKVGRPGLKCWVCSIPEREWLEEKKTEGMSVTVMIAVLRRLGYPEDRPTRHRLGHHFQTHVKRS